MLAEDGERSASAAERVQKADASFREDQSVLDSQGLTSSRNACSGSLAVATALDLFSQMFHFDPNLIASISGLSCPNLVSSCARLFPILTRGFFHQTEDVNDRPGEAYFSNVLHDLTN